MKAEIASTAKNSLNAGIGVHAKTCVMWRWSWSTSFSHVNCVKEFNSSTLNLKHVSVDYAAWQGTVTLLNVTNEQSTSKFKLFLRTSKQSRPL